MARARTIKPGFFMNDALAECDPLARILFAGLWCHADREGRLELRPVRLKAEILPYDDCDIDLLLGQLELHGFIVRYENSGCHYLEVAAFGRHQNPHIKEPESTIPASTHENSHSVRARCEHGAGTEVARPSSLSPFPLPSPIPRPARAARGASVEGFDVFWQHYPRKVSRGAAVKAYRMALTKTSPETLLTAVQRFASQCAGKDPQYVAHASTWLNAERWTDESGNSVIDISERSGPKGPPPPLDGDRLEELERA